MNTITKSLLFLFFLILTACSSATEHNQNAKETTTKAEPTTNHTQTITEQVPDDSENIKYTLPERDEIKMLDAAVLKIEKQTASLTIQEKNAEGCQIKQYLTPDNRNPKCTMTCGDKHWVIYNYIYPDNTNKIMYIHFTEEKDGVKKVYEQYSIGLLKEGDQTFGLILDEKGHQLQGEAYTSLEMEFEQAFIMAL